MAVEEIESLKEKKKEIPGLGLSIPGGKGTPEKSKVKGILIFFAICMVSAALSILVFRLSPLFFIILEVAIFIVWMIWAIWAFSPQSVTIVPGGRRNVREGSSDALICLVVSLFFTVFPLVGFKYYKFI